MAYLYSIDSALKVHMKWSLAPNSCGPLPKLCCSGTRDSQVKLLLGADSWVTHCENGIIYSLDVCKCMFSSGNVTEKARMGRLQCHGETIVDLFAGIGYYTLPLLVHAGELMHDLHTLHHIGDMQMTSPDVRKYALVLPCLDQLCKRMPDAVHEPTMQCLPPACKCCNLSQVDAGLLQ